METNFHSHEMNVLFNFYIKNQTLALIQDTAGNGASPLMVFRVDPFFDFKIISAENAALYIICNTECQKWNQGHFINC